MFIEFSGCEAKKMGFSSLLLKKIAETKWKEMKEKNCY
jgi:hypothetical protein